MRDRNDRWFTDEARGKRGERRIVWLIGGIAENEHSSKRDRRRPIRPRGVSIASRHAAPRGNSETSLYPLAGVHTPSMSMLLPNGIPRSIGRPARMAVTLDAGKGRGRKREKRTEREREQSGRRKEKGRGTGRSYLVP